MKYLIFILMITLGTQSSQAQFLKKLGEKAQKAVERTVERRVEKESSKKTDETLDEVFENKKSKKKKGKKAKKGNANTVDSNTNNSDREDNHVVRTAKDFERGKKIIFQEEFNKVAIGDFPGTWNTNVGGEVVTFGNDNTRWLKLSTGLYKPEGITSIPNNSTLEMDIRADNINNSTNLSLLFIAADDRSKLYDYNKVKNVVSIMLTSAYKTSGYLKSRAKVDGKTSMESPTKSTDKFSGIKTPCTCLFGGRTADCVFI
ncbi:hypothetical protein [Sinomicrobium sp.]